jgi:hypothetical protein
MYRIILEDRRGRPVEAVVLTLTDGAMRVALQGCPDAVELRRTDAEWMDETGEPLSLGFLAPIGESSEVYLPAR